MFEWFLIFIRVPLTFKKGMKKVLKLKKALYRLNKHLKHELLELISTLNKMDISNVLMKVSSTFQEATHLLFGEFKENLVQEFEIIDIVLMSYFYGIKVKKNKEDILISQERISNGGFQKFQDGRLQTGWHAS